MNYKYAMFPGSFDPITNGHVDIVKRLSALYEKVFVVIASNRSKQLMFTAEERKHFAETALQGVSNVEIIIWDGLLVDCARKYSIGIVVRGIRNVNDFNYEFEVSELNKSLCPELEVLFMISDHSYALLRSSWVKELASFGGDVSAMVPPEVSKALISKFNG